MKVKIDERRSSKINLLIFNFKINFESNKKILIPKAISKLAKPTKELIYIFYSNIRYFLNYFLLKVAYNFHRALQIL